MLLKKREELKASDAHSSMREKFGLVLIVIATSLTLVGCVGDEGRELEPSGVLGPDSIVSGIPWSDSEFAGYIIQSYGGSDVGTAILTVERGEDGLYSLRQEYVFDDASLVMIVRVRADNLKPVAGGITMPGILTPVITYSYEEKGKLKIERHWQYRLAHPSGPWES